jgi:hypothetical protein
MALISFPRHQRIGTCSRLTAALIGASALVGCANQQVVDHIPPPNFSGPVIEQAAPPPTVVVKPAQVQPTPIKPAPVASTAIPKSWIPNASVRSWRWIVLHHSATPSGSAAVFDRMHRDKGWDELGYHFVIGNGTNSGNGQVEVGPRWPKQKWGAHAKTPNNQFNDFGIGICLVGNFDVERPTPEQLRSLTRLIAYLERTYRISTKNVLGHGDTGKPTDCPGTYMNVAAVRRAVSQMLASGNDTIDLEALGAATDTNEPQAAAVELLSEDPAPAAGN